MPPRSPYYQFDPYSPYPQMQAYQPMTQSMAQSMPQLTQQPAQQTQQMAQQPVQPQIQNGGFVSVRTEQEARNYPVAPGTSVTFKDENAPYCYTKTKGFSQLEEPVFEKYRLVKEVTVIPEKEEITEHEEVRVEYALKSDLDKLIGTVDNIGQEIDRIQDKLDKKREGTLYADA